MLQPSNKFSNWARKMRLLVGVRSDFSPKNQFQKQREAEALILSKEENSFKVSFDELEKNFTVSPSLVPAKSKGRPERRENARGVDRLGALRSAYFLPKTPQRRRSIRSFVKDDLAFSRLAIHPERIAGTEALSVGVEEVHLAREF
jgi:hypothetical protein